MRWVSVAGLLIVGCATQQEFVPAERVTVSPPDAKTAAVYEVPDPAGGEIGDIELWTEGAYVADVDGRERTVVQIVFDVVNRRDEPMMLSEIRLEGVRVGEARLGSLEPIRVDGSTTVAPEQRARVRAYFALPTRDGPRDVERFDVHWKVRRGDTTYQQRTPFLREPASYFDGYYASDYGYYYGRNIDRGRPFYFFPTLGR